MGKEKIIQIYEIMANIVLAHLKKIEEAGGCFTEEETKMVSAVLNLYMATADNPVPDLFQ